MQGSGLSGDLWGWGWEGEPSCTDGLKGFALSGGGVCNEPDRVSELGRGFAELFKGNSPS